MAFLTPWLKVLSTSQQLPIRLFCFPYAGGSSHIFRCWPETISSKLEVCAVELPGRGHRFSELLMTELTAVVSAVTNAINPYLDRPYFLFGHSLGALLAYEVARSLQQKGQIEPAHLVISGRNAPHFPVSVPPIHKLPETEFIAAIRHYNGTPEAVLENPELLDLFLPVLRADFTMLETYQYRSKPQLSCPIKVYSGTTDTHTKPAGLAAWRQQTSGPFTQKLFPGDHFFLQPQQASLLSDLSVLADQL
ncbi:thioesterase [Leptolyngbya cf. ectocarpi LEGE 11479]|uniref:Thioesterase n=1 Tax=Leptolyngbya cf. ectocarpi LEGE 11479 TaxID=1828722 RepID=A0A929FCF8_LEPEC|nr:alpha/beta fold hydrolase [Leptolyngbya ectocarpi]MBE9069954.1 thioesterase [Leptolyngbya cf. ectocarpi LEGE 11479]